MREPADRELVPLPRIRYAEDAISRYAARLRRRRRFVLAGVLAYMLARRLRAVRTVTFTNLIKLARKAEAGTLTGRCKCGERKRQRCA